MGMDLKTFNQVILDLDGANFSHEMAGQSSFISLSLMTNTRAACSSRTTQPLGVYRGFRGSRGFRGL